VNGSTFWHYKVYSDIRAGSLGRVVKQQCDCRERQFSAFSLAISLETLQMRPALLYSDMQSVVGFSVIPKCMTLNNLEWLFRVKLYSRRFIWLPTVRRSKTVVRKPIKVDTYCQRLKYSAGILVSGNIRFV